MGFKDGTQQPGGPPAKFSGAPAFAPKSPEEVIWIGAEGPAWLRGGSYLVVRRIRIALEHWDRTELDFQQQVVGREKRSGAPLGGRGEFDPLDLDATDGDGNPVIAENAHVRLASAATNGGAQMLRRGYAYNDGVTFTAERWPPWRQGMLYDAGLLFIAYQADPRRGFIPVFETMAKFDAMNQYTTHVGSGLFVCPPGIADGGFIGQGLYDSM
jgi:deferrochelatase/peroxidase EfeB